MHGSVPRSTLIEISRLTPRFFFDHMVVVGSAFILPTIIFITVPKLNIQWNRKRYNTFCIWYAVAFIKSSTSCCRQIGQWRHTINMGMCSDRIRVPKILWDLKFGQGDTTWSGNEKPYTVRKKTAVTTHRRQN